MEEFSSFAFTLKADKMEKTSYRDIDNLESAPNNTDHELLSRTLEWYCPSCGQTYTYNQENVGVMCPKCSTHLVRKEKKNISLEDRIALHSLTDKISYVITVRFRLDMITELDAYTLKTDSGISWTIDRAGDYCIPLYKNMKIEIVSTRTGARCEIDVPNNGDSMFVVDWYLNGSLKLVKVY